MRLSGGDKLRCIVSVVVVVRSTLEMTMESRGPCSARAVNVVTIVRYNQSRGRDDGARSCSDGMSFFVGRVPVDPLF